MESYQMGAEVVGGAGCLEDAKILSVVARCLEDAGVPGFQVRLGHVGVIDAVMDFAGMPPPLRARFREALVAKDLVRVSGLLEAAPMPGACRDFLERILSFPDGQEVLDAATSLASYDPSGTIQRTLEEFEEILAGARVNGVDDCIQIDLGLLRHLDYYTGMVFEVYAPGTGGPIAGGGRYDGLLRILGSQEGAAGFALNIDRILMTACGWGS
jgi:ATP phosphoribosyltransferase regulatory subunit